VHLLLLALAAFLLGLLSFGLGGLLVDPLIRLLLEPSGMSLVMTSSAELWWARAHVGAAFVLPALVLWEGSLVHRLRTGRMPALSTGLLLLGLTAAATAAGLMARGLFLVLVLPQFAVLGPAATVSVSTLELGAWALRAGLAARILAVAWVGLRRPGAP
jgi:hypothetical protein